MTSAMTLSRRAMLATTTAALALPQGALAQTGAPILKRRVPQTGFMLPVVGIGTSVVFEFEDDPVKLEERKQMGFAVMIYLILLTALLYASYRRVWRNESH